MLIFNAFNNQPSAQRVSVQIDRSDFIVTRDELVQSVHVVDHARLRRLTGRIAVSSIVNRKHLIAHVDQITAQFDSERRRSILSSYCN